MASRGRSVLLIATEARDKAVRVYGSCEEELEALRVLVASTQAAVQEAKQQDEHWAIEADCCTEQRRREVDALSPERSLALNLLKLTSLFFQAGASVSSLGQGGWETSQTRILTRRSMDSDSTPCSTFQSA